jgi:hypothetical protein
MLVRLLFIKYPRFSTFLPIQGTSSRTIFQRQGQGGQVEGQGQGRGQKMGSMRGVHRPLVLLSCSHVFHKQCVLHFEDFLVDSDVSQCYLCYNCTSFTSNFMNNLYHFEFFPFTNVPTPSFTRRTKAIVSPIFSGHIYSHSNIFLIISVLFIQRRACPVCRGCDYSKRDL